MAFCEHPGFTVTRLPAVDDDVASPRHRRRLLREVTAARGRGDSRYNPNELHMGSLIA